MAVIVWIFLLNFLLLSKSTFSSPTHLSRVLNAVEKLIDYYKKSYRDLNVDGLFGLRVIEGRPYSVIKDVVAQLCDVLVESHMDFPKVLLLPIQELPLSHLEDIIKKFENGTIRDIDNNGIARLKSMQTLSAKISQDALYYVRKDDEEYFKSMQFIIGNPWALHKDYKQLHFQLVWDSSVYKSSSASTLDEKLSDKCMMEIMGYQPSKKKCGVSRFCIDLMTKKGLTGYGITHQLLWTMLSEQAGCYKELSDLLVTHDLGKTEDVQLEFCTNNYVEVMQVVHGALKGQIIPRFQDLFMEQQFVCPSLGFYQFLSDEFIEQILSWQKDVGCYGTMKKVKHKPMNGLDNVVKDYEYDDVQRLQQGQNDLKFHEHSAKNETKFSEQFINVQPPQLNLVQESNVKKLGTVHMTDSVVIQKGTDLVTKGNNRVVLTNSRPMKSSIMQKTVLPGQRRLLAEKEMEDGCLAHKTAVASGALVIYLRYLLLPGPKTLAENTREMMQQRRLLNINDSGVEKFFPGAKVINSVQDKKAMNNNVLAAQINDKDDDYYGDGNNEHEEDADDENENDDEGKNKNVQFDNDKNDDNGYEGDYADTKHVEKKSIAVKNLVDGDKKELPKPDDTDYTYYEDKNKHDDYNNDEYDEKEDNAENDAKGNPNDKIKLKLINESKVEGEFSQNKLQSPSGVFVIISGTIFVLLIFMYRFLKKRRVHIRYNYKTFNRV